MKLFSVVEFLFIVVFFQFVSLSVFARPVDGIIPGRLIEASEKGVFYSVRPDYRKCASPMCGGYFVSPVNRREMRCSDGTKKYSCYVSSVVFNIRGISEEQEAELSYSMGQSAVLLRAQLYLPTISSAYGELKINAAWIAVDKSARDQGGVDIADQFYAVNHSGIVCVTTPCSAFDASILNRKRVKSFSQLDLKFVDATMVDFEQADLMISTDEGLLLRGGFISYEPNDLTLRASNFYLRLKAESEVPKQCIKTGCSLQLCSDEPVVTTCSYRPEYACFRKATCSSQSNGDCGWDMNKKLIDCLNMPIENKF